MGFCRLLILSIVFFCCSCGNDEQEGIDSLIGSWEVTEISTQFADFFENGINPSGDRLVELEPSGFFTFQESTVEYGFTRLDSLYNGQSPWVLELEKVNAGFNKVNKFTLTIQNEFVFELEFEDQTSNAEKNAELVTLRQTPEIGFGAIIELVLEKQ